MCFVLSLVMVLALAPPVSANDEISLGKIPIVSNVGKLAITLVKMSVAPVSYAAEQAMSGEYKAYPTDLIGDALFNGTIASASCIYRICSPMEWAKNDEVTVRDDVYVGADPGVSLVNLD